MSLPRFGLTLAVLVLVLALAATASAHAQESPLDPAPAATSVPSQPDISPNQGDSGSPFDFLPDPKQWAAEVFNQVLVNLLQGLSDSLRSLVGGVLGSSLNFITQTPPGGSYASPTVLALWNLVRGIANAALVLVALWGGFNLILRDHLGSTYHEALELFPRLVLGALVANTSLWWAQFAIDANNALSGALGQASLPAWENAGTATQQLVEVISVLIYLIASLLLLLQMLMRLALIDVLLVVSPLALLCWVLPQTQRWARLWSSTFFSTVFTQFVQVLALKLGASLLTDLTPVAADDSLLAVFLGVAVLAVTTKIPGLMGNHLGDGVGLARNLGPRSAGRALESRGTGAGRAGGGA